MALLVKPQTGRWIDESNHHHLQWLQQDFKAQWLKIAVAICLTLSTPYILRIVISTYLGLQQWMFPRREDTDGLTDEETQHLTSSRVIDTTTSGRQIFKRMFDSVHQKESQLEARHRFFLFFVVGTVFFVFYAQIIASAILTDKMVADRVGLLATNKCGLYEYDNERWGEEEASRADILMVERERRAAAYAQECYDYETTKKGKAMTCDFFYNSTIGYEVKESTCPFDRKEVCFERSQPGSAVTFDTGFKDSSLLGINANPTYKFRRITTCAALSAERPYVKHFDNGATDHGYLYEYGSMFNTSDTKCENPPQPTTDYTMRIVGHPFDWQAPVYRLNTWATSLAGDPKCDGYQPIADLKAPGLTALQRTQILTLVFVTPLHIIYTKPSNDPIFRADTKFRYPGETRDYWKNGSPKSRAFACIDETLFCESSGKYCWHEYETIPAGAPNVEKDPAYWFMLFSLKKSNTYDSIKLRLGSGLIAQQRVGLARSQPLADNHWQLEAEHMYKTSLARAQFDGWSLASGEDHDDVTYKNTVPERVGDMCGLFKFHTTGYSNVQIWPFILLCSVLPLTLILSVQTKTYKREGCSAARWIKKLLVQPSPSNPGFAVPAAAENSNPDNDAFSVGSSSSVHQNLDTPDLVPNTAARRGEDETAVESSVHASAAATAVATAEGSANALIVETSQPNYGTINSARTSQESARVRRIVRPASNDQEASHADEGTETDGSHDETWSPLLVHSIILTPVYLWRLAIGR